MIVVSDNSPLQYLVLIDCIDALPTLYGQVLTTPQVIAELTHANAPEAVRAWAQSLPGWVTVENPLKIELLDTLDIGEASAISLAKERHADLMLIDERAGVEAARRIGIAAVGTLGVLIEAGVEELIDFDVAIDRLTSRTSFYASAHLIASARRIYQLRKRAQ
jgi:predicted nucleic acid-binding protein